MSRKIIGAKKIHRESVDQGAAVEDLSGGLR